MAELPDRDASDRVLTATDLSELERPSKKRKRGKFSSENEGGVDDSRSNALKFTWDGTGLYMDLSGDLQLVPASLLEDKDWDGTGVYADVSGNFQFAWDLLADTGCPLFLESEGRVDDSRNNAYKFIWDGTGLYMDLSSDLRLASILLLQNEAAFGFHWDGTGVYADFLGNFQFVLYLLADTGCPLFLENKGGVDREDNHDDHVSSENEDRLPSGRSCDDQLSKPKNTLPMSSTEIGKESNEISGVEGSREVQSVAGKCPVQHPNAVQLKTSSKASSSNSDCLDVNSWTEGRHLPPLLLWLRDMLSESIHLPNMGIIFGNLKPENVLMTDRSFHAQLSYIKKDNMDLFLVKYTPEAEDLFSRLRKKNPELRLEAREALLHPFSWSSKVKLHFLQLMYKIVEKKNPVPDQELLYVLESNEPPVFDENWIKVLDREFRDYIFDRSEDYDYRSVVQLVRCLRNISTHYGELPGDIKEQVGSNGEEVYNYFAARFPSLFMKFYTAAFQFCRNDGWFKKFHKDLIPEFFGRGGPVTLGDW